MCAKSFYISLAVINCYETEYKFWQLSVHDFLVLFITILSSIYVV